jgi:hypothetical protein
MLSLFLVDRLSFTFVGCATNVDDLSCMMHEGYSYRVVGATANGVWIDNTY